jgi:hypothetical protein
MTDAQRRCPPARKLPRPARAGIGEPAPGTRPLPTAHGPGDTAVPVQVRVRDIVDYRGTAFQVAGLLAYRLPDRTVRLARLVSGERVLYLELSASALADRVLVLAEIPTLDLTAPPPATIYHGGESFLLRLSGVAEVSATGDVPDRPSGPCTWWRYRAAGDRFLQIEEWPDGIRMLEGASVHRSMLEVRPEPSA